MSTDITDYGRRNPSRFIVWSGLLLFLILSCYIGYKLINAPRYIVLSIQPPDPYSSDLHGEWSSIEYSTQIEADSKNSFYIWRAEEIVIDREKSTKGDFDSWESIATYFNDSLINQGWVQYETSLDLCREALPETQFLPKGIDGYLMYASQDRDKSLRYFPIVCLAIWPEYYSDGQLFGYHVVLATQNPSIKTYLNYLFD